MTESELSGGLFTVSQFAKIARTSKSALHHYDKIGLLSPVFRRDNNYRCYSIRQLAGINVIRTLRKLGVPLAKIEKMRNLRTPEIAKEILLHQIKELDSKSENLQQARNLLFALLKSIQSGLDADQTSITVRELPAESIILGETNDYSKNRNNYDALISFYEAMYDRCSDWELSYPVWGVFTKEQIRRQDWNWPDRYYFYNLNGQDRKPAALYAIGYTHAGYGGGDALFKRMIDYIDQNGFEICGNTYAEYPFNEICVADDKNYLMRLMITVRKK